MPTALMRRTGRAARWMRCAAGLPGMPRCRVRRPRAPDGGARCITTTARSATATRATAAAAPPARCRRCRATSPPRPRGASCRASASPLAITHGRPGTAMVAWKTQLSQPPTSTDWPTMCYTRFVQGAPTPPDAAISGTPPISGTAGPWRPPKPMPLPPPCGRHDGRPPQRSEGRLPSAGVLFTLPTAPPATARAATAPGRAPTSSTPSRATSSMQPRARGFNRVALYAGSEGRRQRDAGLEAGGHAAADGRRGRIRVPDLHRADGGTAAAAPAR
jgi:hypothetical protein